MYIGSGFQTFLKLIPVCEESRETKFLSKALFELGLLNTSAASIILLLINSWTRFFTSGDTLIFDLFSLLGKLLQPNNNMSIR